MLEKLKTIPFFQELYNETGTTKIALEQECSAIRACIIYTLFTKSKRDVLVIGAKETLKANLRFFTQQALLLESSLASSLDAIGHNCELLQQKLNKKTPNIIFSPIELLEDTLPDPKTLHNLFFPLKVDHEYLFEEVIQTLETGGYQKERLVQDKGQYAVRGSIIDFFGISKQEPIRLEFFDETLQEIRTFDVASQKTTGTLQQTQISLQHDDEKKVNILAYLKNPILILEELEQLENNAIELKMLDKLPLKENPIFLSHTPFEKLSATCIHTQKDVRFELFNQQLQAQKLHPPFVSLETLYEAQTMEQRNEAIYEQLKLLKLPILCIYEHEKQKEFLEEITKTLHLQITFEKGYLSQAFIIPDNVVLLPYTEFTKRKKLIRKKIRTTHHVPLSDFHELHYGDLVVHFHSGIGKYIGIEKQKDLEGKTQEFFAIEYAQQAKLYVPIHQSHLLSRYIGAESEKVDLHKIGSKKWQQAKVKASQAIIGYAKELLDLEAKRQTVKGHQCETNSKDTQEFYQSFEYEETEDQLKSIAAIEHDLMQEKPMDRLLCGDVGYGKTEVAMRATFKMIVDGAKQVAVMAPTTILAEQHGQTFHERMQLFGINVKTITRFQTKKEQQAIIEEVKNGQIDCLIGTHRLVSNDIEFKNLGLLIIDEEQRFGVRAKEKLKKMKDHHNIDCLTLSATPIPRTLYFSLVELRSLSTINSPPHDRLPIKTIITETNDLVIKEAIERELLRGGQVFFIHNRVESIHKKAEQIQSLVPKAKISIAHGQMKSSAIETSFKSFKEEESNILLATTIVENGVDIPNVNTILIDRADTYGIAPLYQLRGRVGRWDKMAFAYLLVPANKTLSVDATKRLHALASTSGFGGGMKLAMKDLEIRGAGDILGTKQSGQMQSIGFHLYAKLLKRAINALKNKKEATFFETKMEFSFDAKFDAVYIHSASLRLELYHRLGECNNNKDIDDLFDEIKDRFGPLPNSAIFLKHISILRLFANQNGFTYIKFLKHSVKAQRQAGKKTIEKSFLIPNDLEPKELILFVMMRMKENFF